MNYSFPSTTYYNDGYAQFNSGSGWTGWDDWGYSNQTDGDLQFYGIDSVSVAAGYRLDVSTNVNFTSYVSGDSARDVGNVTSFSVTGLSNDWKNRAG